MAARIFGRYAGTATLKRQTTLLLRRSSRRTRALPEQLVQHRGKPGSCEHQPARGNFLRALDELWLDRMYLHLRRLFAFRISDPAAEFVALPRPLLRGERLF